MNFIFNKIIENSKLVISGINHHQLLKLLEKHYKNYYLKKNYIIIIIFSKIGTLEIHCPY